MKKKLWQAKKQEKTTDKNQAIKRNCPWGADNGLIRKRVLISYSKYLQRTKENHL